MNKIFRFEPITEKNREAALALKTAPGQEGYIETVEQCLREAAQTPCWRPVLLLADGKAVGFAMYGFWADEPPHGRVWLDRFLIGASFQSRGYAKAFLPLLLDHIRKEYGADVIYLSVIKENTPAIRLYEKFGFSFNGEIDPHGEAVMTAAFS